MKRRVRNLWRRYTIALSLFGGLTVTTLLSLRPLNDQLNRVEGAINMSGWQRTLSQRIALLAVEQSLGATSRDPNSVHELDAALREFSAANEVLAQANVPRPGLAPTALQAIYYRAPSQLAARSRSFVAAVERLQTLRGGSIPEALRVAAIAKDDLLPLLKTATAAYELKAHALTRRVQTIELLTASGALLLIVFEAALIFWPAQRETRLVIDELEDAIEVLRIREGKLAEAARFSQLAEELAGLGHWRLDVRTSVVEWSPEVFAIHGLDYSPDFPDLDKAIAAYHPDDRELVRRHIARAATEGLGFNFELRLVRTDGEIRNVVARGVAERDASGAATSVIGVFMDVTEARRAEKAVRESEAQYRLLAENATDMIITSTLDGHTTYVSPSALRLTGYDVDQITGVRTLNFVHPDDGSIMIKTFRGLVAGAPPKRLRWRGRHKAGHWVWFESMPALASDPETNAPIGFVDVVRDVTQKHMIEEAIAKSEARYKLLAENGLDVICEMDVDGKFTYVSPSVYNVTGYEPSKFIGFHLIKFVHDDDVDRVASSISNIVECISEERSIEYRLTHRDGHPVWLEARPRAVKDPVSGRVVGLTDVIRDISERKALEANLRAAKIEAEAAAVAKSDFLANMSHELRTPLTSIQGFSRLLADQPDLSAAARRYTDRILTAGDGLMEIINDVLDFSKLESGQMTINPVATSINTITLDVLDLLKPQADKKTISLHLMADDIPAMLMLDSVRMRQVLLNLVGNAIKFTEAGRVDILLRYARSSSRLTCTVSDTGPGIAADHLERLFQRFSQIGGDITRQYGGTGLGLAICKGLVSMMGGDIGVRSVVGKGSTFWFEVPAAVASGPAPLLGHLGGQLDGVRVLVVDDQDATRELVFALLTRCGAELSEAGNGQEAVDISARAPFDLILMDIRMPVLDGIGAAAAIRSGGGPNANIPIVAFSADVGTETLGDLSSLSFDGQVAKPLQPQQLVTTLVSLVFNNPLQLSNEIEKLGA